MPASKRTKKSEAEEAPVEEKAEEAPTPASETSQPAGVSLDMLANVRKS